MRQADYFSSKFFASVFFLCAALNTQAKPLPPPPATQEPAPTASVAELLEIQRCGQLASSHRQSLPGGAQSRTWQRYLDSFSHPIREHYIDESFGGK